jgi:hypothetical protein
MKSKVVVLATPTRKVEEKKGKNVLRKGKGKGGG